MGFLSADGLHESYLRPLFGDGRLGTTDISAGWPVSTVPLSGWTSAWDMPDPADSRPASAVTGWVIFCDCYAAGVIGHRTWRGPAFRRVGREADESLRDLRLYANDADVLDVSDRPDVEAAVRDVWYRTHVFGADALAEVNAAAKALELARERLRAAVAIATSAGLSRDDLDGVVRRFALDIDLPPKD